MPREAVSFAESGQVFFVSVHVNQSQRRPPSSPRGVMFSTSVPSSASGARHPTALAWLPPLETAPSLAAVATRSTSECFSIWPLWRELVHLSAQDVFPASSTGLMSCLPRMTVRARSGGTCGVALCCHGFACAGACSQVRRHPCQTQVAKFFLAAMSTGTWPA